MVATANKPNCPPQIVSPNGACQLEASYDFEPNEDVP
jgi:hypothetical protein